MVRAAAGRVYERKEIIRVPRSGSDKPGAFSKSVTARARKIHLLLMDVDGVLTDGRVNLVPLADGSVVEMKSFHSQDGAGLKLARAAGLRTGVISGRNSPAVTRRAQEVGMEFVHQGCAEKLPAYEEIIREAGVGDAEVAYIGDDLPDIPVLQRVGLALATGNAVAEVRRAAHHVARRGGGDAGVRELIELILKARGAWRGVIANAQA
jgi:3-deoxy-D-manno-octulosonate 8-phosphate phosphatase (KDO 8-P phosphatase)